MTVDTEMPVFEATEAHPTPADAAGTQELLRTMAAVVRTVFGVALQAPAEAPVEDAAPAAPAQLAPVSVSLPSEAPTLVSVPVVAPDAPASIAVDFLPPVPVVEVQQPEQPHQPVDLSVVSDPEPATSIAMPAMPALTLGESSWTPAPMPAAPAEPVASLAMPDGYPVSIPVPAYAAPVLPEPAAADRHSLALLQEIAFLDE